MSVIKEEAARAILRAGGFNAPTTRRVRHTAHKLDEITRTLIGEHYLNRWQDEKKKQLRKRPLPRIRRQFLGGLQSVWFGLPHIRRAPKNPLPKKRLKRFFPTVIWSPTRKRYEGRYVRFVQACAGVVADHIAAQIGRTRDPCWQCLIRTLRTIEESGADDLARSMEGIKRFSEAVVRAEDGMEALAETQALGRWVTTLGKSVDLHVLVYDLLITEGPADARALAKRLNRKPKEVAKIMRDLHQLGRIEVFQISP